ncbi:MAG: M16 family metallopeptidase [Inquilinaceae bacterium]
MIGKAAHRLAVAAVAFVLLMAPAGAVEVQRVVSPLGIEAWLVESPTVPVISMEFAFRGGSAQDPAGKEGRANLVSVLLDEGAGDLDSQAFQQSLTDAAISLRFTGGVDAFYGSLSTVVAKADTAFDLLHLALTEPRFDDEAVERMRAAVLSDIRRRVGDPEWMARRAYFDAAFPNHPYGRPSRGTVDTLQALEVADLREFVETRFTRDSLVVGVAGDISAERLAVVLDAVFGALPPASGAAAEVPAMAPLASGSAILVERDGPQSIMLTAQPGIDRADPDYYAASVVNHILGGGGFESRLTQEIREKRGLTYGIRSGFLDFEHANLLVVNSDMSNANVAEALSILKREWRAMAQHGPTEEELDDAKTFMTGSFPLQFTSSDRIAGMLVTMQLDSLGIDYIDRRNALIEAVTLDQARRVAAALLDADALTTVVVGAPGEGFAADTVIEAGALAARELKEEGT